MKRFLFLGLIVSLCYSYSYAEEASNIGVDDLRPKAEVEEPAKMLETPKEVVPLELDVEMPLIPPDDEKERSKDIKTFVVPEKFDAAPIKKDNSPTLKPLVLDPEDGNIRTSVPVGVEHKDILQTGTDPNGYTDITSEETKKDENSNITEKSSKQVLPEVDTASKNIEKQEDGIIYLDVSDIKKEKEDINTIKLPPVKLIKDSNAKEIFQEQQPIPSSVKVF